MSAINILELRKIITIMAVLLIAAIVIIIPVLIIKKLVNPYKSVLYSTIILLSLFIFFHSVFKSRNGAVGMRL